MKIKQMLMAFAMGSALVAGFSRVSFAAAVSTPSDLQPALDPSQMDANGNPIQSNKAESVADETVGVAQAGSPDKNSSVGSAEMNATNVSENAVPPQENIQGPQILSTAVQGL